MTTGSGQRPIALLEQLADISDATLRLIGLLDTSVLAERAAQEAQRLLAVPLTAVAVREGPTLLSLRGTCGSRTGRLLGLKVPYGRGAGGRVLASGDLVRVADYEHDPHISHDFVDLIVRGEGVGGTIALPLRFEGEIVGVLYASTRSLGHLGDRVVSIAGGYANHLGPLLGAAKHSERTIRVRLLEERRRIALELHDTVAQRLFGIGTRTRKALDHGGAGDVVADLEDIEEQASKASSCLRDALLALAPAAPAEGIATIMQSDVDDFSDRSEVAAQFVILGEAFDVSAEEEMVLLSVLREGLLNIEKHAGARSVVVALHYGGSRIELVVQDDGRGPLERPPTRPFPRREGGWGLSSLAQKVERLGGHIELLANEDQGATLRACLPVAGTHHAA